MNQAACVLLLCTGALSAARVAVIADAGLNGPARRGLANLSDSLTARGFTVERVASGRLSQPEFVILAGLASDKSVAAALTAAHGRLPAGPQALAIRRTTIQGKQALVLCASDARGLMYAALDVADRVSWSSVTQDPFARVRETSEAP